MCDPEATARRDAITRLFDATVAYIRCDESGLPAMSHTLLYELLLARRACSDLGIPSRTINETLRKAQFHAKTT